MTRRAKWLVGVGGGVGVLIVLLSFTTGSSTMCLDGGRGHEGGCVTEYIVEPLGWRFSGWIGEWLGVVTGTVLVGAILSILVGAGWLFQRFMDKREHG